MYYSFTIVSYSSLINFKGMNSNFYEEYFWEELFARHHVFRFIFDFLMFKFLIVVLR